MRLLVLGGTGFLGYHVVEAARTGGHAVTVFACGGRAPAEDVEMIRGDRHGDLSALEGRSWDAALDTFSEPEAVARTARLLSGSVGVYGFVSGITNYHPRGPGVVDEESPLRVAGEAAPGDPLQERGLAKLGCERAVLAEFAGETFIVRPGIMVGPRDPTDRFSYWPARMARALAAGEEVLAPGDPERPVQFTDARDLAGWMVEMLASGGDGLYNAVGPGRRISLRHTLDACSEAASEALYGEGGHRPRLVWAGEEFLKRRLERVPEERRPLWFPEPQIPFDEVDSSKALSAGLAFRPELRTARQTLRWLNGRGLDGLVAGVPGERNLLREWREGGQSA